MFKAKYDVEVTYNETPKGHYELSKELESNEEIMHEVVTGECSYITVEDKVYKVESSTHTVPSYVKDGVMTLYVGVEIIGE